MHTQKLCQRCDQNLLKPFVAPIADVATLCRQINVFIENQLVADHKVHRAPIAGVGQLVDGHVEYGRFPLGTELLKKC